MKISDIRQGVGLEERRGLRAGKRVTLPDLRQLKILPNALFSLGRRGNRCAPDTKLSLPTSVLVPR